MEIKGAYQGGLFYMDCGQAHGESVNHLLLHCTVAQELWLMPRGVVDLLSCWSDRFGKFEVGAIWKAIPHCLMWCVWHERNNRTFSGEEQSIPALKFSFLQTLHDCLKASNLVCCFLYDVAVYIAILFINEIITYQKKNILYNLF